MPVPFKIPSHSAHPFASSYQPSEPMPLARYKNVIICADEQVSSGEKVYSLVPAVIPCSTAHKIGL